MLDLLEAGLAGLRLNSAPAVALPAPADTAPEIQVPLTTSDALLSEIRLSGLSLKDVAKNLGVEQSLLDDWLADQLPVPALAVTTLQLITKIAAAEESRKAAPVAERRNRSAPVAPVQQAEPAVVPPLQTAPAPQTRAGQKSSSHPFSRIEEL